MNKIARKLAHALSITNEKGVTAIEYGLLAALISLAIITAVSLVGTNLSTLFNDIALKLKAPA